MLPMCAPAPPQITTKSVAKKNKNKWTQYLYDASKIISTVKIVRF